MDDFPDLVIERILEFTNIASHPVCRSICSRWKAEIERLGLALVIDDRNNDLLDFIQNIVIKEAHVKYLSCEDSEWLTICLDDVKTLIFSGHVNPDFLKTNLLKATHWQNLKKLYFYGSSLISQPFTEPGSDMEEIHCSLQNLKELHIILPSGTYMQAVKQFTYGIVESQFSISQEAEPEEYVESILDERAIQNARLLLNSITAPNLKSIFFSMGPHSSFNYIYLFHFVAKHGKTLEKLICPSIIMEDGVTDEIREMADKLRSVRTKLKSVFLSHVSPVLPKNDIWTNLVLGLTELEDIFLQFDQFPLDTFSYFATTILSQNFKTLRNATIKSDGMEHGAGCLEIDMQLLSACPCLEILRLIQRRRWKKRVFYPVPKCSRCTHCGSHCGHGLRTVSKDPSLISRLKNINGLPTTLKVFETTFSTTEDFDGVRFLKEMVNLEELKMTGVRRIGLMEQRSHVLKFIKFARLHRLLNVFEIEFGFSKNVVPDIGGSWAELRRIDDIGEPSFALFQLMDPTSAQNPSPWWTVESIYFGGMFPENPIGEKYDTGFEIEDEDSISYMRCLFDAIDKGLAPSSVETCQPFDVDQSGNSYQICGSPEDEICWGCTRTPLRYITAESSDYHRIYNKCKVDQGQSRIVLLLKAQINTEQTFKSTMNLFTELTDISSDGPNDSAANSDTNECENGPSINFTVEPLDGAEDLAHDSDLENADFEEKDEMTHSEDHTNESDPQAAGTLVVFNEHTCFILPGITKPLII